jgi:arsenite methyltransferase
MTIGRRAVRDMTTATPPSVTIRPADYGVDAPGVIRNLAVAGAGSSILAMVLPGLFGWAIWPGAVFLIEAWAMVWSSKVGKLRLRDRLMREITWRGDETVLDVGCGRGLMLMAAARCAPQGRAIGVDLWRTKDQSGNGAEVTWSNARAEGVAERVEINTADARALPLADATVDVVVSNLALHNIPDLQGRARAVQEIARVLKPGGQVRIVDFRTTALYERTLRETGCSDVRRSGLSFLIFPPVRIVSARKA